MLIYLFVRALNSLPHSVVMPTAKLLGRLGYRIYRSEQELALRNIQACYPRDPDSLHKKISIRAFQHIVISAIEILRFSDERPQARPYIKVRNLHHITEALGKGRGVVLATAHYGNVGVLPFALEGVCKEPAYIMRRPTRRVSWVVAQFRAYRDTYLKPMSSFHSLASSIRGAVQAGHLLKRGNAVIVVADLTWGSGAIPLNFLGIPYNMSRVPASLSLLTGASLIPIMTSRNADGSYEVVVESPIEHPLGATRHDAERIMTGKFAKVLERYVRACPEQWFWMHHHGRLAPPNNF
jgi:Kdo2-lipid IVA lauroyltransferase/acyltransferase